MIEQLIRGLGLPNGLQQSLLAKLRAANAALARGATGAARNQLDALLREIQAQSGKRMTEEQALGLSGMLGAWISTM